MELLAQRTGDVFFADHAALDEERAESLAVGVMRRELERVARDDAGMHEQIAEAHPGCRDREVGHRARRRGGDRRR